MTLSDRHANPNIQSIALVAHDQMKDKMIAWVKQHESALDGLKIYASINDETNLHVERLKSGPLGGDAQIGALIAEDNLDALIFFIDPLSALPHDVDVKSLLRLAILYDTLLAVNEASASVIIN